MDLSMNSERRASSMQAGPTCSTPKLVRPWECSPHKSQSHERLVSPIQGVASAVQPVPFQPGTPDQPTLVLDYHLHQAHLQQTIVTRQAALLERLGYLSQSLCAAWPLDLMHSYHGSVYILQQHRQHAVLLNEPTLQFEQDHLSLITSMFQQVEALSQMCQAVSTASPTTEQGYPSLIVRSPNDSGYSSGYSSAHTTPLSGSPAPGSPALPQDNTPVSRKSASSRCSRYLNSAAVRLMEEWYRLNFDHPYPTDQVVSQLATVGNITTSQVKKWMANKRVRSCNTLSFNGSIHPKKLKRLQRQQLAMSPASSSSYDGKSTEQSTRIFNNCCLGNMQNSQPSAEERNELAAQTGLTVSQVQSWMATKHSHVQLQSPSAHL